MPAIREASQRIQQRPAIAQQVAIDYRQQSAPSIPEFLATKKREEGSTINNFLTK
jgi:hypothetical protein